MKIPRLVISGLSGGSGKTLLSLGLTRAFIQQGLCVQPCKKGPDYIDAAWLGLAARRSASNLDPYFLTTDKLRSQLGYACTRGPRADLALIEGNRGLYDGRDLQGSCSTAQVAMALQAPVVLTLNCAKMTRTAAALVAGVIAFEPKLHLAGIVLNNTGSPRHAAQVRNAIEHYTGLPVLGSLPRMSQNPLPERHMGLTLHQSAEEQDQVLDYLASYVAAHTDLKALLSLAHQVPPLQTLPPLLAHAEAHENAEDGPRPRIGFVRDDALWFYYEENLEALQAEGAELIELSLLEPSPWPSLDGLYLGGGFPELFASTLTASPHLLTIRSMSEAGIPIYAECGGFMILSQAMTLQDATPCPMAGLFPVSTSFFSRPQGLGYVEATTLLPNPFHPMGSVWRGHEFHYSRCEVPPGCFPAFCLRLHPGTGMGKRNSERGQDGLCVRNTFAAYTHLFAPAVPHWAPNFVAAARTAAIHRLSLT